MKRNLVMKFFSLYIFSLILLSILYIIQYNKNSKRYLETKLNEHQLIYKSSYDEYKVLSQLIFDTDINTKETIDIFKDAYKENSKNQDIIRENLFTHLQNKYTKLKKYNLKQLHFHLPNNVSFLRMHRPDKYGDDLTNYRETVNFVNTNKKYIDGFEEGRIFNGFRFVYPLFDGITYIGSVEISFSMLAMIDTIHKTFNLDLSFLVEKNIVDKKLFEDEKKNYIDSPNKDFYFERKIYEEFPPASMDLNNEIYKKAVKEAKAFTILIEDLHIIKTVIPLINPVSKKAVALMCICQKDTYLLRDKNDLISKIFITSILLALIFFLFYKQALSKAKLLKLNKELDLKVKLEVLRGRKQDIQIFNQSKMASIGKMMKNIAHQWRQPLSVISSSTSALKLESQMGLLDKNELEKHTNTIIEKAEYLSQTLNKFKDCIEIEDKEEKPICIQTKVDNVLSILKPTLENKNIKIKRKYEKKELFVSGVKSELFEIFNAIINNSCDAYVKNPHINNKTITITIKQKDDKTILVTIKDNAGGIKEEILDNVFDPYFTTKHESIGIGISLYLVYKLITEKLKGKITIKNKSSGVKFFIELPLIEKKA